MTLLPSDAFRFLLRLHSQTLKHEHDCIICQWQIISRKILQKTFIFLPFIFPTLATRICKIQKDYPSDSKSTTVNITSVNQITFDQSIYRLIYSPLVQDQHQSSNLGTFKPIFYPNGSISFQT